MQKQNLSKIIFIICLITCAMPFIGAPIALIAGFVFAYFLGSPFPKLHGRTVSLLLKMSIVGLGFGININDALKVGHDGLWLTITTIAVTIIVGYVIGKLLKVDKKASYLISSGTAICGGSAIAAVAPVIKASDDTISTSLGVIFFLNAIALLVFPFIGHFLQFSQYQFGLWSAVAIHDTSSVVGASATYGAEALQVATTVKLARTLWIIPLSFLSIFLFDSKGEKVKIPWFILFFVLAMLVNTYFGLPSFIHTNIVFIAKRMLIVTLFLVGTGLSIQKIKAMGWRFLLLGFLLWVCISVLSAIIISHYY